MWTPFWKKKKKKKKKNISVIEKKMFDAKLLILDYHLSVIQNYGSPTHVTMLKVAPNMADSISLKESIPLP